MKKLTSILFVFSLLALSVSCSSDGKKDSQGLYNAQEEQSTDELGMEEQEGRDEIYEDQTENLE